MTTPPPHSLPPKPVRAVYGHLAQFGSVVIMSSGFMVQKRLVMESHPLNVVFWQFVLASVLMWLLVLLLRPRLGPIRPVDSSFWKILAWGVMAPGGVMVFAILGAARTDGISLALLWGALPLIVPLLGVWLLKEHPHWSLWLGALVGFGGLILLTFERQTQGLGTGLGTGLVVLAVLAASFSQIIGRQMNKGARPWFHVATLQVSGACLGIVVLAVLSGAVGAPPLGSTTSALSLAYLVVVMTLGNYTLFNIALKALPVAWVALYVALNPVLGTLAAIALLGEVPRGLDLVGMAVIIAGVSLPHVMRLRRLPS